MSISNENELEKYFFVSTPVSSEDTEENNSRNNTQQKCLRKISFTKLIALYRTAKSHVMSLGLEIGNIKEPISVMYGQEDIWGRCEKKEIKGKECFVIKISNDLMYANERAILTTLAHEILHSCKDCQNHGEIWTKYANQLNEKYGYNIKEESSLEEKGIKKEILPSSRYAIQCVNCKMIVYKDRKTDLIKYPETYRCTCGGSLKRIK